MHRRSHGTRLATLAVVSLVALGLASAALGADSSSVSEPWSTLDARERALLVRVDPAAGLDPAIRAAIAARASEAHGTPSIVVSPSAADDAFAWGAAALGVGVGVAAMCLLLGCATLVRSHGRLRSI